MLKSVSDDINVVRGVAALGVIWAHSMEPVDPRFSVNGAYWVWIFFVTSGYLQGQSFAGGRYKSSLQGAKTFWRNRARRILPLFWLALTIGTAIRLGILGQSLGVRMVTLEYLGIMPRNPIVGPLWSIAAELHLYIMTPFFCLVLSRHRSKLPAFLLLALGAIAAIIAVELGDNSAEPRTGFGNALLFIIGLVAAYRSKPILWFSPGVRTMLFSLAAVVAALIQHASPGLFWTAKVGMMLAVSSALLVFAAPRRGDIVAFFRLFRTPLSTVGRYCYGIYVYAALIAVFVKPVFGVRDGLPLLACQLLALPLAYLSYTMFERHFVPNRNGAVVAAADLPLPT
ncbi:MAG: acyltransferase [Gemmatimonadaceae bacterium]|nr:acyltransferase [Gemmatimonadaceae bacterium]